jgi:predicted glutamine amidotransferase
MCGIFAWSGKDPKKFNKSKFDILGLYNIDRGRDSCGVFCDGEILVGIDKDKLYSSFIANKAKFFKPLKYPIVIGHTRQASAGSVVNIDNVHPFGFGNLSNGDYEFVGCHNGTLYNKEELAKEFNIETSVKEELQDDNAYSVRTRHKIDSEILLEILYTSKNFKVLNKYQGGAALVFSNLNEPNVIYVWKGASKTYDYHHSPIEEERPLFYFQETKNSVYISSLQQPLEIIGGVANKNLFTFKENTVYKITDGDVSNAEQTSVSRINAGQFRQITSSHTKTYGAHYYEDYEFVPPTKKESKVIELPVSNSSNSNSLPLNIYTESTLNNINYYKGKVVFNKLRHYRNGHLITGIYTWVPNYGYYKLGEENISNAKKTLFELKNKIFLNDYFIIDDSQIDKNLEEIQNLIPFKEKSDNLGNIHYFIQGVKILTSLDYSITYTNYLENYISKNKMIDYVILSEISTHPIIDLSVNFKDSKNQGILYKSTLVKNKEIYCPLGSEKIYTIENGNLIHSVINKSSSSVKPVDTNPEFSSKEELIEFSNKSKENEGLDITNLDSNTMLEMLEESVNEIYFQLEDVILQVEELNNNNDPTITKKLVKLKSVLDYLSIEN